QRLQSLNAPPPGIAQTQDEALQRIQHFIQILNSPLPIAQPQFTQPQQPQPQPFTAPARFESPFGHPPPIARTPQFTAEQTQPIITTERPAQPIPLHPYTPIRLPRQPDFYGNGMLW